jgi:hypothetical protein
LKRFPGISPILPSSSPYKYARTEGYFLHAEIAIRGALSVGKWETDGRGSWDPTLSQIRERMGYPLLWKINN